MEMGAFGVAVPEADRLASSILNALKPFSFRLRQNRETVASAVPHSSAN